MKDKDLMAGSYTYQELLQAYDDFETPAAAIYVGEDKVNVMTEKDIVINEIQVTLSTRESALLHFQVLDAFDIVSHSFQEGIRDSFAVGTLIEAALGYGSNLTTVFQGYITECRVQYGELTALSVSALDLRYLMKKNKRVHYKYQEKTYSEIFEELIGSYCSLYDTLHVDSVTEKAELIQNNSDYDFVTQELCRRAKHSFFVVGGEVYFRETGKEESAFLELEWGNGLLAFEKGIRYCNEQITMYSSQEDKSSQSVSAQLKTEEDTPALLSDTQVEEWELGAGLDQQILQNYLDQRKEEKTEKNIVAGGSLIGLPEVVPGRYLKISGIDPSDSGTYYIQEVRHEYGEDGFVSSFTAGDTGLWDALQMPEENAWNRQNGLLRAVVKENWNEEHPGCVLVELLSGTEGRKTSRWLPVMQPYCGNSYGIYFLPEIDTEVIVGSLTGDMNSLLVIGAVWNQSDQLPADTAVEGNTIKKIRTKGGQEILFNEEEENAQLTIHTAENLHISMTEKEKKITISDAEGKNTLCLDGDQGTIELKADKKLSISVGEKNMAEFDADTGKLVLTADHIEEKGQQDLKIQTQNLSIKGEMTELKAGTSFKINSSGIAELKGTMVKIN